MDSARTASPKRPTVVIIGSGFGGLFAARALAKDDVDVVLIAKTSHHLFQPLLYQVATGILSQGRDRPVDAGGAGHVRRTPPSCSVRSPRSIVAEPDRGGRPGGRCRPSRQPYDYLIVAAGRRAVVVRSRRVRRVRTRV
jgi:NADH dehydrogenase